MGISAEQGPIFPWADPLGPAKVLYLHDPACGLKAVVVIDRLREAMSYRDCAFLWKKEKRAP